MRSQASLLTIDTVAATKMGAVDVSVYARSSHSRGSSQQSGNSDYPTPATPTFSLTEHSRVASSTSSLASSPPACDRPESPTVPLKSVLHDLAEDPEREDSFDYECRHRAPSFTDESDFYSAWTSPASADYDLWDGFRDDNDNASPRPEREIVATSTIKSRLSQRMPSLSRKLRDKRSFSSLVSNGGRSAPASRAPSIRSPSITKSMSNIDVIDFATSSSYIPEVPALPSQHIYHEQSSPVEFALPEEEEDPIDRRGLSSTPLLPPCMMVRSRSETGSVQSPLQSPTVAEPSFSFPSASATPVASTVQSQTLSTRPSTASFAYSYARNSTELCLPYPIEQSVEYPADEWADLLGHANFDISPAPYVPAACDLESCRILVDDWEAARKQYLAHANCISEDYGPNSNILRITEQKWASIDAQWKGNHETALERARANGIDVDDVQCLSECTNVAKIPSLPKPAILSDSGEIVGPMVTYVSRIKPMPKKNAFLRFFSELRPFSHA